MAFKKPVIQTQEIKSFTPTAEQVANKDLVLAGKDIKIVAGAGSGKSSSLRYIASCYSEKSFLVLCFNSANAKESNTHAERPENIVYSTGHSLAYRAIMDYKMRNKLSKSGLLYSDLEEFYLYQFAPQGESEKEWKDNIRIITKEVLQTVEYFCRSSAIDIDTFSLNRLVYIFSSKSPEENIGRLILEDNIIRALVDNVKTYWNNLINSNHPAKITHDVYLKLYDLREISVDEVWDDRAKAYVSVDVLCLDESQDTNPVMESIFRRQSHLQRIIVGDPNQQLYAWRGANDMMKLPYYSDFTTGYLTESFRFNQGIADKANVVLEALQADLRIVGSGSKTEIDSRAILCRTNASVVERIFDNIDSGKSIYTSINTSEVFSKLFHLEACYYNNLPKYPCKELSHIVDRESLEKAVEYSDELQRLLRLQKSLVKTRTLWQAKQLLEKSLVKTQEEADIVITTCHASKGMEYAHVTIDDDFLVIMDDETTQDAVERLYETESLLCLLYVSLTRAQVEVEYPWYLKSMFDKYEELDEGEMEEVDNLMKTIATFDNIVQNAPYVVYRLYDHNKTLLFIGVTCNLGNRLKQHVRVDDWFGEVCLNNIETVGYGDRNSGYEGRREALLSSEPLYKGIYQTDKVFEDNVNY